MIDINKVENRAMSLNRREAIILPLICVILISAIFSDILRIPGTALTFFRISLPVAIVLVMLYPIRFKRLIFWTSGIVIFNTMCNFVFYGIYRKDLQFQVTDFLKYTFFYFLIFLVVCLVGIIKDITKNHFERFFSKFLCIIGGVLGIVSCLNLIIPKFFGTLPMDNRNNYACYLAAVLPLYLVKMQKEHKIKYVFAVIVSFIIVYLNDSKASLIGMIVEVALLVCISSKNTKKSFIQRRLLLPLGVIASGIGVLLCNPTIHGYSLQSFIFDPVMRILKNNPYPIYTVSTYYRTNTTLYAINEIGYMKGVGLGAGNLGFLLKDAFPNLNPEYTQALNASTLSLHNAWLEFCADFGIVGILLLLIPLFYAIKLYFGKKKLSIIEKAVVLFIFSFPLWSIGPSGVYTQYYLFCVIMYFIIADKSCDSI